MLIIIFFSFGIHRRFGKGEEKTSEDLSIREG